MWSTKVCTSRTEVPKLGRVAALAGRAAVAARIPGEEVEVGQVELVDQVRHAARVLVAAMEEHDRAARGAAVRRPVAVEELDAVVRGERVLVARGRVAALAERDRSFMRVGALGAGRARTRLTMVQPISARRAPASASAAQPGSGRARPTQRPSAPNTNARSLLPIGPS